MAFAEALIQNTKLISMPTSLKVRERHSESVQGWDGEGNKSVFKIKENSQG